MAVPVDVLRRVPLLSGLQDEELAELGARFRERVYDAGAPVVSRGSSGVGFFIIAEGEAVVGAPGRPGAPTTASPSAMMKNPAPDEPRLTTGAPAS